MGLLEQVRNAVDSIGPETDAQPELIGAYWCDDCSVRIPLTEDDDTAGTMSCPDCGESMRLERSPDSSDCAC